MIRFIFLVALATLAQNVNSQQTYTVNDTTIHLWGKHDVSALKQTPYSEWYHNSLEDFNPDLAIIGEPEQLKNAKVEIYLGTWCGDSQLWVPKFLKVWEELGLSEDQIEMISLHNETDKYKQGPEREEKEMNIHRVPTFIFYRDEKEIGRIVERPLNSLEMDIAQINKGIPSEPRYQAVTTINEYFENYEGDTINYEKDLRLMYRKIRRNTSSSSELNTYGYVLKAAGQLEKAHFVFLLNSYLFRHDPNCHDSLGEIYMEMQNWSKAQECFYKVLDYLPKNERAISNLSIINEEIKES